MTAALSAIGSASIAAVRAVERLAALQARRAALERQLLLAQRAATTEAGVAVAQSITQQIATTQALIVQAQQTAAQPGPTRAAADPTDADAATADDGALGHLVDDYA